MDGAVVLMRKLFVRRLEGCTYKVTARYSEQKEAPISRRRRALRQLSESQPAETSVTRRPMNTRIEYILDQNILMKLKSAGS
jgi:hypothetical protein